MLSSSDNKSVFDDWDKALFESLSPQTKAFIESALAEQDKQAAVKATKLESDAWKTHYVREPPGIKEFLESDYYLGSVLMPSDDSEGLFPAWKTILVNDFDLHSRMHNIVFTGSLGIGKTYVSVAVLLYRLTLVTLLKNPQMFFNLGKGSRIAFNVLSVTKAAVAQTAFGDAMNFMAYSPYFLKECSYNPDLVYSNYRIPVKKDVFLTAGSRGQHILGQNVIGVLLDEGNWRLEADPDTKAYELYDEARTRISNRFRKTSGYMPAISILASSARDESSFTEKVIKEINDTQDPSTQKVYRNSVYKIKRHKLHNIEANRWFKVVYGLKNIDPYILSGWYTEAGKQVPGNWAFEAPPPGASVELVPEMYFSDFKRRCKTNLQSIAGISTGGSHRLFGSLFDYDRCIELAEKDGVVSPTLGGSELLPISMDDDRNIWDYLVHKNFLMRVQSRIQPKRNPSALRFAHVDLATQTMAGVAVCHLAGNQLVEGLIKDGKPFSEYRLIVEYDFILAIVAGAVKPISLEKIQNFFFWLRDRCSYRFGLITADMFASEMPLQMLESRGFKVDRLSMDKTKGPYYSFKMGVEELRVRPHKHRILEKELEDLVDGDKKIDHPAEGSKDVSDAVAGSYVNAINSAQNESPEGHSAIPVYSSSMLAAQEAEEPVIQFDLPMGYPKAKRYLL